MASVDARALKHLDEAFESRVARLLKGGPTKRREGLPNRDVVDRKFQDSPQFDIDELEVTGDECAVQEPKEPAWVSGDTPVEFLDHSTTANDPLRHPNRGIVDTSVLLDPR